MKKTKRFLAVVLCMLLMLTPLAVVAETVTVQAAGPQTVKVKLDKMNSLRVDGGASANNYLMQTMADISDLEVKRPRCVETTALGAAYLAGLAVGYWQSAEDITRNWSVDRVFRPAISEEERTKRIKGWNKANCISIFQCLGFYQTLAITVLVPFSGIQ